MNLSFHSHQHLSKQTSFSCQVVLKEEASRILTELIPKALKLKNYQK